MKLLALYIPFFIIPFVIIYLQNKGFRLPTFQRINLALLETCYFNTFLIVIFKTMNGRMRPNFYSLCGYTYNNSTNSYGTPGMIGDIINCKGDISDVWESRRSFPSGHSAYATSGMVFISLFIYMVVKQIKPKYFIV